MAFFGSWAYGTNPCTVSFAERGRPDFYNLLYPRIIEEDLKTGTMAYLDFWDNPDGEIHAWDQEEPIIGVWDRTGMRPVLQRLFFAMETQHGELLDEIESMDALIDPDTCPIEFIPFMAASMGYDLSEDLSEGEQRSIVKGLFHAYKKRGEPISWKVFFRMLGYKIIAYPLWKKEIYEENDQYSQDRYETTAFSGVVLPGAYTPPNDASIVSYLPFKPKSLVVTHGAETLRDNGKGVFLGSSGNTGTVNYLTGAMLFSFTPAGPITLAGEQVDDEYPFHAARVDFDFWLVPLKGGSPPDVNDEFIKRLLAQLEEVRPIHVLIRTFNLIMPLEEDALENFAAENPCCGPDLGVDYWTARQDYYLGDVGPLGEDGGMTIDRSDGSKQHIMEDVTPFIRYLKGDPLYISSSPSQPFDGAY